MSIFISYRSEDSPHASRIRDDLAVHFGSPQVFLDRSGLVVGEPFPEALERAVRESLAVVLVVGPAWAAGFEILTTEDWVRRELETAREAGCSILPVLCGGTPFPSGRPIGIEWLADTHFLAVQDAAWQQGILALIQALEEEGVPRLITTAFPDIPEADSFETRSRWVTRRSTTVTIEDVKQQALAMGWRLDSEDAGQIRFRAGSANRTWVMGSGVVAERHLPLTCRLRVKPHGAQTSVEVLLTDGYGRRPAKPRDRFRVLFDRAIHDFRVATGADPAR